MAALQNDSDWAISFEIRRLSRLPLYGVFVFFPLFLALFVHFRLTFSNDPVPSKPQDLPDYVNQAVPIYLFLIVVELAVAYSKGLRRLFSYSDSMSSAIQGGLAGLITSLFRGSMTIIPYIYINEHYGLFTLRDEDTTWFHGLVMFVLVELGYYWSHRFDLIQLFRFLVKATFYWSSASFHELQPLFPSLTTSEWDTRSTCSGLAITFTILLKITICSPHYGNPPSLTSSPLPPTSRSPSSSRPGSLRLIGASTRSISFGFILN